MLWLGFGPASGPFATPKLSNLFKVCRTRPKVVGQGDINSLGPERCCCRRFSFLLTAGPSTSSIIHHHPIFLEMFAYASLSNSQYISISLNLSMWMIRWPGLKANMMWNPNSSRPLLDHARPQVEPPSVQHRSIAWLRRDPGETAQQRSNAAGPWRSQCFPSCWIVRCLSDVRLSEPVHEP